MGPDPRRSSQGGGIVEVNRTVSTWSLTRDELTGTAPRDHVAFWQMPMAHQPSAASAGFVRCIGLGQNREFGLDGLLNPPHCARSQEVRQ